MKVKIQENLQQLEDLLKVSIDADAEIINLYRADISELIDDTQQLMCAWATTLPKYYCDIDYCNLEAYFKLIVDAWEDLFQTSTSILPTMNYRLSALESDLNLIMYMKGTFSEDSKKAKKRIRADLKFLRETGIKLPSNLQWKLKDCL